VCLQYPVAIQAGRWSQDEDIRVFETLVPVRSPTLPIAS